MLTEAKLSCSKVGVKRLNGEIIVGGGEFGGIDQFSGYEYLAPMVCHAVSLTI